MSVDLKSGELEFIGEYTRSLLVDWALQCLNEGSIFSPGVDIDSPGDKFVEHAFAKGWIGKRKPHVLTQGGYKAAASFLRR